MCAQIYNSQSYLIDEPVTFEEILAACLRAGVLVFESVRFDDHDPTCLHRLGFFHQLGSGKRHGPFEHEDQAYEDAFHTYYLWPW
jgi:hypothetical protein